MPKTLHNDFIQAASQYPDHIAIWSDSGTITYKQLDERTSALAAWLLDNKLAPGERTGIILSKSIDAVIAALAAMRAGNAYVPLGDTWPSNRINSILAGGDFKCLIIENENHKLQTKNTHILNINHDEWLTASTTNDNNKNVMHVVQASDLAYILYTSGSTGVPKGVCVSHSSAHFFPDWAKNEFNIEHTDRVASIAPFTFDLSTFDLFTSLSAGATIYLVPEKHKLFPSRLSQFLQTHEISIIYAVPSTLALMLHKGHLKDRDLSKLRTVLFAGEVFLPQTFLQFRDCLADHVQYYNLYGPTETNVCTYYKVDKNYNGDNSIPIGLGTPGTRLILRSEQGEMDENATEGELCVTGPSIMSNYWGMKNENADYWTDIPGETKLKAYRTGDIVIKDKNGYFLYKGRRDKMVKIWGYRVELGEIESGLLKHTQIEQAAVIKRSKKDKLGEELVAFIVATDDAQHSIDIKDVFNHCKQYLTHYMIPRKIYQLKDMPINNSEKIDRLKLESLSSEFQLKE